MTTHLTQRCTGLARPKDAGMRPACLPASPLLLLLLLLLVRRDAGEIIYTFVTSWGGSVAEWLACWT